MQQNQALIAELKNEAARTRTTLERVPLDKGDWKPHAKSTSIGRLATHIAELPSWITTIMSTDELDMANREFKPHVAATTEELLAIFDKNINEAVATLEKASDADFAKTWTFKNGGQTFFTLPKAAVVRSFTLSHTIHHRAQLGVYLRLLDVPVPQVYGPTADEAM